MTMTLPEVVEFLGHPVGHRKTDDKLIMAVRLGHLGRVGTTGIETLDRGSLTDGVSYALRKKARARGLLAFAKHLLTAATPLPVRRTWRLPHAWQLDQGDTPQCVAYTKAHWHRSLPVGGLKSTAPAADYARAKQLDGYPTEDGTDASAMLKVATEQGIVDSTWWWRGPQDTKALDRWLLSVGPVWFGALWSESMFRTTEKGEIPVTGPLLYGHETLLIGSDRARKTRTICNSWGADNWGRSGRGTLADKDFDRLMSEGQGDVVGIVERRPT